MGESRKVPEPQLRYSKQFFYSTYSGGDIEMSPTEILMQEHRLIEQVLDCLEALTQRAEATGTLDVASATQALEFFSVFADRCHHAKEEDCLFPLLEEKGFSREQGPTGVMLDEHEEGRRHVSGMAAAAKAVAAGNRESLNVFVSHSKAYIELLRLHIQKEDHCLFQMAEKVLRETDRENLLKQFLQVEQHDLESGIHEKYVDSAAKLASRWGISTATVSSPLVTCCGH